LSLSLAAAALDFVSKKGTLPNQGTELAAAYALDFVVEVEIKVEYIRIKRGKNTTQTRELAAAAALSAVVVVDVGFS